MNKELEANTTLSHYRLVEKIGAGGMGEVYLALDTKLDRKVALKILPSEMAANQHRMRRFKQEATAAAALNHPNIAHIYEIGESDGTNFIAMEFVEGVTLREKIHREQTELRKLLRYLQHVAEGLAKAHAAGTVHRDLKPDNIMITHDGHAKILDFGLAKLIEGRGDGETRGHGDEGETLIAGSPHIPIAASPALPVPSNPTSPGLIMGTVGYMSPEQAQAKTVDQRSDIFSFGCILYEAATGRKPFASDSVVDTLHKIIHDPAPAITDFNPSASPELQRVIRKCLAKEPEKRYQTIRDTANDLEELLEEMKGVSEIERSVAPSASATTSSTPGSTYEDVRAHRTASVSQQPASSAEYVITGIKQHRLTVVIALVVLVVGAVGLYLYLRARNNALAIESIAVMPFENESGNSDVEYLSDGMTETLMNSLSQLPGLSVKARSSVFRYKGKETDAQTIGKELGVQAILNGRVVKRGDNLTLFLELVDTNTGDRRWGAQYSEPIANLITLQNHIARDVSQKLSIKLSGADQEKLSKNYTENAEAYQLYLQGRYFLNKRTPEAFRNAIPFFERALANDPNYALAYTGLADSYALLAIYGGGLPPNVAMPKAKDAARKALALDPDLAEAHESLAHVLSDYEFDFAGAEKEYKRAFGLNPNLASAHQWYGEMLTELGRFEDGMAEIQRALDLDPLSLIINRVKGRNLVFAGKIDQGIDQLKRAAALDVSFPAPHGDLAMAYQIKGNYAESVEELATQMDLLGDKSNAARARESFSKGGWKGFLLVVTDKSHRFPILSSFDVANFYVALGEKEAAIGVLNKAYDERSSDLRTLKVDPRYDPIQDDPRVQDLYRKLGLP